MSKLQRKTKKILIIEDEKLLGEMYKDKFSQEGFKVILIPEAEKGIITAKKEKPDLVLLDILLQKKNGIFFLEEMKKDKSISSIPVIAFSNYDDLDIRKKASEMGAKCYLIKTNHTPEQIIKIVKKYLPIN